MQVKIWTRFILIIINFEIFHSEYFSSSSHLTELLQFEIQLHKQLDDHVKNEENRIARLKKFYSHRENIAKYITACMNTTEECYNSKRNVEHPVNNYQKIRRGRLDWLQLQFLTTKKKDILKSLTKNALPSDRDIIGAKSAILRLQETFALSSRQIVDGIVRNPSAVTKLGAEDAFEIGMVAFDKDIPRVSANWMSEALRLLDKQILPDNKSQPLRINVLKYLSKSEYKNNNLENAYKYTTEMLKLDPKMAKNITYINATFDPSSLYQRSRNYKREKKKKYQGFYYTLTENVYKRRLLEIERAKELCRGETDPVPRQYRKHLVCWYKRDHPMLLLKPAKVERLYPKPEILMFRNAMTASEITQLKHISRRKLARMHYPAAGNINDYRVSESAWIDEQDSPLYKSIGRRIESYTGLDMSTAESLQVANYGIGGHYEPHFDFGNAVKLRPPPWKKRSDLTKRSNFTDIARNQKIGERIATMLFYMSDVEVGGSTVFTNIGLAVEPSKGDSLYWYNLNHDGSGDYETRHAACPVLIGEKWVCNRWIHERGQEFRRRCNGRIEDD